MNLRVDGPVLFLFTLGHLFMPTKPTAPEASKAFNWLDCKPETANRESINGWLTRALGGPHPLWKSPTRQVDGPVFTTVTEKTTGQICNSRRIYCNSVVHLTMFRSNIESIVSDRPSNQNWGPGSICSASVMYDNERFVPQDRCQTGWYTG